MAISSITAPLLLLASCISGYVLQHHHLHQHSHEDSTYSSPLLIVQNVRRDGPDPADFSWIKRWAAIGDSFTAGIGSGNLYTKERADWECSRYDHTYPVLTNAALGPTIQDFQYVACSGARSTQIQDQVTKLKGDLDMVMLTAGGNDLCLVGLYHLSLQNRHH